MAPTACCLRCVPDPAATLPKRLVASRAALARVRARDPAWPLAAGTTASDVMFRAACKAAQRTQNCTRCCAMKRSKVRSSGLTLLFGPYFAYLAALCNESRSLVDCKKRPKFRLSLPCRPATDSAALLFHRAAFTTKCNDIALARASSLPASWLTAWVLWTGFFLVYYGGNVRTKYSKTSVFPRLYRVFPCLYAIRKPVGP